MPVLFYPLCVGYKDSLFPLSELYDDTLEFWWEERAYSGFRPVLYSRQENWIWKPLHNQCPRPGETHMSVVPMSSNRASNWIHSPGTSLCLNIADTNPYKYLDTVTITYLLFHLLWIKNLVDPFFSYWKSTIWPSVFTLLIQGIFRLFFIFFPLFYFSILCVFKMKSTLIFILSSVQWLTNWPNWTLCDPIGQQHATPPCLSPTPRVYSNSCPLSRWCHPTVSSSVIACSSCLQSFPASGSFQMSQLFTSGGQNIGVSALASVLPMNTQDWSPLGWTGWILAVQGTLKNLL